MATTKPAPASFDALDPKTRIPRLRLATRLVAALLFLVAAAVAATVVVAVSARPGRMTVEAAPSLPPTRAAAQATSPPGQDVVFVHVDGAVRTPGLYRLQKGSRVVDAVAAAGGFTAKAQRSAANLARVLSDGEQILIPQKGEPLSGAGGPAGPGGAGPAVGAPVNLNTATGDELETLPRVGPALAGRILSWRAEHGRFERIDDLMSVSGIGEKTFAGLRDRVTV
ncbi:MAG TPA: helix-hairpin-helix domain-containing protein [Microbacteriaceae bacterium]|nr:helix-hairpin-helix domain-containing protein [Microbacteriaceae bacterium]